MPTNHIKCKLFILLNGPSSYWRKSYILVNKRTQWSSFGAKPHLKILKRLSNTGPGARVPPPDLQSPTSRNDSSLLPGPL